MLKQLDWTSCQAGAQVISAKLEEIETAAVWIKEMIRQNKNKNILGASKVECFINIKNSSKYQMLK